MFFFKPARMPAPDKALPGRAQRMAARQGPRAVEGQGVVAVAGDEGQVEDVKRANRHQSTRDKKYSWNRLSPVSSG